MLIHFLIVYGCFCITVAELSSCKRLYGLQSLKHLHSGRYSKFAGSFSFFSSKIFYLFIYREKRRKREREEEKHRCVGDTSIDCLLHAPSWGPGPQARHVSWLGIELATFWFSGPCSVHWASPARAADPFSRWKWLLYLFLEGYREVGLMKVQNMNQSIHRI